MRYTNPIIRGFYPDPSICYAEGYYYIVCSSFEFFPGLPIFQSKNMIDWTFIGHCLTRKSQLNLTNVPASGGLFAPTIRYHKGRFYVVVTDTTGLGNFYVYTDDINGEWSEPVIVNRGGIDPSLLFDGNKTYFMSNGEDDFGVTGISLCEIDIDTGDILTKSRCISQGTGGRYIEAPHLYHIGDYYYLLVAEGGTEYGHMECVLRSKEPYGPYECCPSNPVLTNRNLGGYFIQGAGHADIVKDENDQWWMVHIAFRQIHKWKQHHHLGREVFLEPIYWNEDDWFTVGTDGTSRASYQVDSYKCTMYPDADYPTYNWAVNKEEACYLRSPDYRNYCFISDNQFSLKGTSDHLNGTGNVTFLGMRQKEFQCIAEIGIDTSTMLVGQQAGVTVYMNEGSHYDLFITKESDSCRIACNVYIGQMRVIMDELQQTDHVVKLKIAADAEEYRFFSQNEQEEYTMLGCAETKYLSSEVAGGFTGVIIAAYCISNEEKKSGLVHFQTYK